METSLITKVIILILLLIPFKLKALEEVSLVKCVDGDTAKFKEKGKTYTYRFLAIDTPELDKNKKNTYLGRTAADYTCFKLNKARTIKIEYEINTNKEDKYNRKLVYVFVDDELLQKDLVSKGYAEVKYAKKNFKYYDILKAEEEAAKSKNIGIWKDSPFIVKDVKDYTYNLLRASIIFILAAIINKIRKKYERIT